MGHGPSFFGLAGDMMFGETVRCAGVMGAALAQSDAVRGPRATCADRERAHLGPRREDT